MKKLVLSFILSGLVSTGVIAADLKIGVVNVERILTEAPQVDAVNTSISLALAFMPKRLLT